jgi:hypothetical protein
MQDADDVLACYRRIQRLLERLSVSKMNTASITILIVWQFNVNLSIWKVLDKEAMVRSS